MKNGIFLFCILILVALSAVGVLAQNVFYPDYSKQEYGFSPLHQLTYPVSEEGIFDFSQYDWVTCFDSLHEMLSERYAFTEWRGVDWDSKKTLTRPLIETAMSDSDTVAFTAAMYSYLYSIPDGHIMYRGNVNTYTQEYQAGSYMLNMIPLTDGTVVANIVTEDGPAFLAGICTGDRIISWNGIPVEDIPPLEVYNNFNSLATNYGTLEGRLISRYEMLSRDSIGAVAEVVFQPHGKESAKTVVLTCEDDGYNTLLQAYFLTAPMPDFDSVVSWSVLDEEIGYLRILHEGAEGNTLDEIRQTIVYQNVKSAIQYFNDHAIDKLVMDLRFNMGGNDLLGAVIAGFFHNEPSFYEYITGNSDEGFEVKDTVITQPESPCFLGEVVAMVGPNCISTGEGIPMMIQRLSNGRVVSFWGSNGSFGMVAEAIILTDSLQFILYPFGRSLDIDHMIQLDSDKDMTGGVQPDIRIPLTVERVIEQWQQGKDVELEYAKSLLLDVPENKQHEAYQLYPNPAKGCFRINCQPGKSVSVVIRDIHGRILKQQNHFLQDMATDISDLKSGFYLVYIQDDQEYSVKKLIVQ
ncbi:MAG: T9SS type A sorting domain-containing protein [Sphingobacteriia bacterium]|nr:T9SS type A sorting domain-containing protein [Sphingobacteriia bacterium]